ncbi:AtpZ/AtpI family protein [Alteribacillus sp. JSM 102045]|uniref:AtpZ/AtpI family protein n=1 Tax=Alteribacillus sp. JSM 102045 TaxID=1562101 RepID=UPI0035C0ADBB
MTNEKKPPKSFQTMALTSAVLSYLVGPVLIGIFSGRWLDGQFGTEPLFLIVGLLGGIASGVYGLVRLLEKYLGDDQE